MTLPVTSQAAFAAALVDEWVRAGVTDVVVAPGSHSTPLALAVDEAGLRVHVHLDERSAGFYALGVAMASGRPAPVVVTSGTAAAELVPVAVEADLSRVPMILCTSDRPPLRGRVTRRAQRARARPAQPRVARPPRRCRRWTRSPRPFRRPPLAPQ